MLSQYITRDEGKHIPSSLSSEETHITSDAVDRTDRYSASIDKRATVLCFLDDQEIGRHPK